MLIKLESTNENLSWVIQKNPESIPTARIIRQGVGIGWFENLTRYKMVFLDGLDECSFNDYPDQFAYLNPNEYAHPQAGLNLMSTLLDTATKKDSEYDLVEEQTLIIESLQIKDRTIKTFQNHFQNFVIEAESLRWPEYKRLKIKHTGKVKSILQFASVFLLTAMFDNHQWFDKSSDLISKYLNMVVELDVPYLIRYMFKFYLLQSKVDFDKAIPILSTSPTNEFHFCYGSNQRCREDWVKSQVRSDTIVDIGCGEGNYMKLSKNVSNYYAFDTDPEVLKAAERKAKRFNNVQVFSEFTLIPTGPCDIILSEVIEHIELDDLPAFLQSLNTFDWQRIIITTPNAKFNDNYLLHDDFRHDDHKWEMGGLELYEMLSNYYKNMNLYAVGDVVNGVATTNGLVIER